ncbi:tetratricopeptide repeat protein [Terrabacter sp. BE26]|uniref:tetratricopeptide repeat protein n=1 Tax=Terrabacter sp. BE26 TaxID=2898152 RepID=UPI0035BE8C1E
MNTMTPFPLRLSWARGLVERGDHQGAATALAELVEEAESARARPADPASSGAVPGDEAVLHSVTELRLLLARAYFQSAQLGRAEATLLRVIEDAPTDAYAHLLLGRTLQRAGRHAEAARPLALAEVLGDYDRPQAYGGAAHGDSA